MDLASEIVQKLSTSHASATENPELAATLQGILADTIDDCSDIAGALVTSCDGLPKAKSLSGNFDIKRFSAMSSALLALSTTLAKEAGKGKTLNIMIEGEQGNIYVISAGKTMLLTVFTKSGANLGMTLARTRRAAESIASACR